MITPISGLSLQAVNSGVLNHNSVSTRPSTTKQSGLQINCQLTARRTPLADQGRHQKGKLFETAHIKLLKNQTSH